jgi:hypothetical protein
MTVSKNNVGVASRKVSCMVGPVGIEPTTNRLFVSWFICPPPFMLVDVIYSATIYVIIKHRVFHHRDSYTLFQARYGLFIMTLMQLIIPFRTI